MKTKTIDCVEMKRLGSIKILEKLKDMTLDEELSFWKSRNDVSQKERNEHSDQRVGWVAPHRPTKEPPTNPQNSSSRKHGEEE